jgi:hypothetical protein
MADRTFSLPQQWEDWASWILGIWLMISPWALRFDLSIFRGWEEWINVVLGLWLLSSPWILAISDRSATINFMLVGVVVLALALYEIRGERARRG